MKKVFFIDIDGTILPHGNNQRISEKTKYAFKKLKSNNCDVVIATGKSRHMVEHILKELKMENYITCNGAVIYKNTEIYYDTEMNLKDMKSIIEFARTKGYMIGVQQDSEYYMLDINIDYEIYRRAFFSINLDIPKVEKGIKGKVYQLWLIGNLSESESIEKNFPGYKQMKWHENAIDIISEDISKESAIKRYIDFTYDEKVKVYCFGDGENDIEMLKYADIGVAMGNASDRVKGYANTITSSCENDGVYEYLVKNKIIKEMRDE